MEDIETRAEELDGAEPGEAVEMKGIDVDGHTNTMLSLFIYELGLVDNTGEVEKIVSAGKGAFPTVYVCYLASRWCFNIGCEHKSNRVYLTVLTITLFFFLSSLLPSSLWVSFSLVLCSSSHYT